ncbi:hypothetical protein [Aggregicoccus sp. 17bor-14]|uniref:hypothetical protein n=1 Tax=Myxococcaceae TaxID=31 RepID=UPI00351AA723
MVLLPLLLTLLSANPGEPGGPVCRTADSKTVCGYSCVTDSFGTQCAQTPQGRCKVVDGKAVCFDPPAYLVRIYGASLPEPECKGLEGQAACGYHCAADFGDVKCARTPKGVCQARSGKVTCFDPPPVVYASWGSATPAAECRAYGQKLACGYGCVSGTEGVACAATPAGVCRSEAGRVLCFDPAPSAICALGRSLPPQQCRSSDGQAVCGYACTSAFSRAACARTPYGLCKVSDAQVTCFDPPLLPPADSSCLSLLGLAALEGP